MIDKAHVKTGFFLAVGVLLALLVWGLAQGVIGKVRH